MVFGFPIYYTLATLQIYVFFMFAQHPDSFIFSGKHNSILNNLLLSPQKIDLAAGYLTFFADYMLLSAKKNDLAADNPK